MWNGKVGALKRFKLNGNSETKSKCGNFIHSKYRVLT